MGGRGRGTRKDRGVSGRERENRRGPGNIAKIGWTGLKEWGMIKKIFQGGLLAKKGWIKS